MMGLSLPHLIIVALVVLVLFGRGRISEMMGDFGKGVKSFKDGMSEETTSTVVAPPAQIAPLTSAPITAPVQPQVHATTVSETPLSDTPRAN